mgnify:FL=1
MFFSVPYVCRLAKKVYHMESLGYHSRLQHTNKKNYLAETRFHEYIRASYV